MKKDIIAKIVDLEWEMFSKVVNYGGRAGCQDDPETFRIMRVSQAEVWSEELLDSYYADLVNARLDGRNLMTEKYARMMESTFPDEYVEIAEKLPPIDEETRELIEEIIQIHLEWKVEIADKYPALTKRGRVIYTKEDTRRATSFETYLRGELETYSPETIRRYYKMTLVHKGKGVSAEEAYLHNMVIKYGYSSLEQAEKSSRVSQ